MSDKFVILAKELIEKNRIMIFSKSYCPYCTRVKDLFSKMGEKPYVLELDSDENGSNIQNALYSITRQRTVPNVFINKIHLGGCDDTMAAQKSGKLSELLKGNSESEKKKNKI